ncbi:MAG TPA: Rne/Rng family ribonuclease, partial [Planctomycetota bacterium]|nr:Rne/Rng family ribonuclease [Planctomycetota bacterium]
MTEHQSPEASRSGTQGAPAGPRERESRASEFGAGLVAKSSSPSESGARPARRKRGGRSRSTSKGADKESEAPREAVREAAPRDPEARKDASSGGEGARKKRPRRRKAAGRSAPGEEGARDRESSSKDTVSEGGDRGRSTSDKKPVVFWSDDEDTKAAPREGSESGGKKRSKRSRSRRKVKGKEGDAEDDAKSSERSGERSRSNKDKDSEREGSRSKKTAKKRSRRKARSKSEDIEDDDDRDEDEDGEERTSTKGRKRRSSKKASKTVEELEEEAEVLRTKTILVNAAEPEERRVVLLGEDNRIEDLLMTAESQKNLVNDIYRGKVVNLEPAIGAAFVDFGQGRNGFLHTSDVMPVYGEEGFTLEKLLTTRMEDEDGHPEFDDEEVEDEDGDHDSDGEGKSSAKASRKDSKRKPAVQRRSRQRLPISDLLNVGDQVVVQVTKDAIGDKGPTLTTYISIPGRYLVLMPSMARTGVSRKIPDENERRRLKRILAQLEAPEEMGVIVRTAGVGKLKSDLRRDLNYLLGVWETFETKLKTGRGPTPLYQESDVATRTLRDLFNKETKEVLVDDFAVHEQMVEFAERLMPEHVERIQRYEGQRPIFHHFGIEQDFEQIFNRRVELPSGGSIVFDQAEALVAIDVNSGRTRTGSNDFEEIALKTNLEAVPEIALQIRLRDLGGIIVCDFIDMMKSSSNRAVERALRTELSKDRARSKMGRIGQFGLLELTRQRLGPGTHKKVFQACPRCRGTGRVRTIQSRAQAILRRLGSALTQKGFSTIEVKAHPEVVDYIKEHLWDY